MQESKNERVVSEVTLCEKILAMAARVQMMNLFLFVVGIGTIFVVFLMATTSTKGASVFRQIVTYVSFDTPISRKLLHVDVSFLTSDFLHDNPNGTYPSLLHCPYTRLRKAPSRNVKASGNEANVSCQTHSPSKTDCETAASYFGKPNENIGKRKCDEAHYPDICSFVRTEKGSYKLKCDASVCKNNEVSIAAMDENMGIVIKWNPIKPFDVSKVNEFVQTKMSQNHTFSFIKCGSILQALIFPPKVKRNQTIDERRRINVYIIVLDCVSRPHFFRVMRESVAAMRKVIYDESINATVLDYELFQSLSMHTFDNIRPLFSGIVQGNEDFSSASVSLAPLGIHVLSNEFKKYGYQTVFQEDLCWHDSWGIMLNNLIRTNGEVSEKRFQIFKDTVKKHNLDHIGITHFSCEVIKKYGYTNHYDRPSQVCLNGKFYNRYFLEYLQTLSRALQEEEKAAPLLLYQHFNSGHTATGTRIQNDDGALADFILNIARDPNSFTIILSDHGHTRTSYGQTEEGKRELYHPLLFMIVPHYVAGLLGKQRMEALVTNQKRILSTLDIHKALLSLHDEKTKFSTDYKVNGIFSKIPGNRTCGDVPLMPLARCQCEGADSKVQDNSNSHRWMAEFAIGTLNNIIQEQFSKGSNASTPNAIKGFGNCVRYVGNSFRNIIQTTNGKMTIMDIHIDTKGVGLQADEVTKVAVEFNGATLTLKSHDRQTMYNKFTSCDDKSVDLKLCICDKKKSRSKNGQSVVLKTAEMKNYVSWPMFGTESKIKDLYGGCLFQIARQHSSKISVVYEVANSCKGKTFKINVQGSLEYVFVSRSLPFQITVEPNGIYFMFSAVRQILNHSHMDISISASEV